MLQHCLTAVSIDMHKALSAVSEDVFAISHVCSGCFKKGDYIL
ncbi:Uncharacterized protein dnl_10600 [Desulfonema limicola]|uniref:Uncharacterized protein n=1 Tax=Desulfonema limicola TaxID=45656 RepID=A0A975B4U1_9BACT|nr:Uncharacterized protein dnl_10600 [Desulfonema limicola]